MEELLVELLIALLAPHREEDVAADELVDDLAVRGEALQEWTDEQDPDNEEEEGGQIPTWKMTFLSSSNWIIICRVSQFTFQAWAKM